MAVSEDAVGKVYPPEGSYEVGREKIAEFATAIGSTDLVHFDADAARAAGYPDVIAPPTFAVLVAQRADARVINDPEVGIDFTRVVHGEQQLTHHRPMHAGDVLHTTTHIDTVRMMAGNAMVTLRDELADSTGEKVCTATSMLVVRADEGDDA